MDFAARVSDLRKSHGLTQKQLAANTGLSEIGVQSYERRVRKPTADKVIALADYFGVSTDYLLGRVQTPDSVAIKELAYDGGTLYIRFRCSGWYRYLNVPEDVYKEFVDAQSKGKFFLENIMTNYASARSEEPPTKEEN